MKKNPAGASTRRAGKPRGIVRKPVGARASQHGNDGLTCSEAQVDALLSEGEST